MKKPSLILFTFCLISGCKQQCDNSLMIKNNDPVYYYANNVELPPNSITKFDLGGEAAEGSLKIVFTYFNDTIYNEIWYRSCKTQTKTIDRF